MILDKTTVMPFMNSYNLPHFNIIQFFYLIYTKYSVFSLIQFLFNSGFYLIVL